MDAIGLLDKAGMKPTEKRLLVVRELVEHNHAVTAKEILDAVRRRCSVNKVTLYRILDALVEAGVAARTCGGDGSFHYCLAVEHPMQVGCHYYCKQCGRQFCLHPQQQAVNVALLQAVSPGTVETVETLVNGVCEDCAARK